MICCYHYIALIISTIRSDVYVGIHHGGQHDSNLLGLSVGLQWSIITYTYNIVATVLLCTQMIWNKLKYVSVYHVFIELARHNSENDIELKNASLWDVVDVD